LDLADPPVRPSEPSARDPTPARLRTGNQVAFQEGTAVRASAVVWATGFRAYYSWVAVPDAFDEQGRPRHERGITATPGLAFVGLPWQHTPRFRAARVRPVRRRVGLPASSRPTAPSEAPTSPSADSVVLDRRR
jgi:hypothetical protein